MKDHELDDETGDFETEPEETAFSARLVRSVRTDSSEIYIIWQESHRIGQVDLHYGWDTINATLILERDLSAEEQADLVDLIDEEIVTSYLPRFSREDFLITVFRGQELDPFSDGPDDEDFEDEDEF